MPMTYQLPTFEQSNPNYVATQKISDLVDKMQNIRAQQIRNQFLQPTLEQSLEQAKLQNQISQAKAQYAPEQSLADLIQAKNTGELLGKQVQWYDPKVQSELAATSEKMQWLPYQALGQYAGGLGKYGMSQYYQSNPMSLMRALQSPELESLYQTNPKFASDVANTLAGVASNASNAYGGGSRQPATLPTLQQALSGIQAPQQQMQMQQQAPQQTQGMFSPQDIAASQAITGDILTRKSTPAAIMTQQYYGNVLDNLFAEGDKLMPSVVQYAGVAGKGKKGADALKSAFGENSPEYTDYMNFTHYVAPSTANEMRRTLGGQATDTEIELMSNLADPTYWDSNPELAMKQWNYLTNLYKHSVGGALSKTPTQVQTGLRQIAAAPATTSQSSQGMVKIKDPNGSTWSIPKDKVEEAKKRGAIEVQ